MEFHNKIWPLYYNIYNMSKSQLCKVETLYCRLWRQNVPYRGLWVLMTRQYIQWDQDAARPSLIWRLGWGRICLQAHMVVSRIISSWVVELKVLGHSQFLSGGVPPTCVLLPQSTRAEKTIRNLSRQKSQDFIT
jgi:hypothetical protein